MLLLMILIVACQANYEVVAHYGDETTCGVGPIMRISSSIESDCTVAPPDCQMTPTNSKTFCVAELTDLPFPVRIVEFWTNSECTGSPTVVIVPSNCFMGNIMYECTDTHSIIKKFDGPECTGNSEEVQSNPKGDCISMGDDKHYLKIICD